MNKFILFSLITVYSLSVASQNDTIPQNDSAQYLIKLKTLVISEFHNPKSYSDNTRTLFVIPVQTIRNIPASNLNDLIENISTVDIRRRGTGEIQSDLNIRGGSFEQSLVLLNGIPVNDPQTGHHNLDLPLTHYDIERVEILYGPGAELYGPNSFNGAVNIITYSFTNTLSAKMYAEGGSYNTYTLGTKAEASTSKAGITLSTSKSGSDGYMYNTDYRIYNGLIQGFVKTDKKSKLYAIFGYKHKNFGANKFYSIYLPDAYEQTETYITALQYTGGTNIKYTPSIYYRSHFDNFSLNRFDTTLPTNKHLTQTAGIDIPFFAISPIGKTSFGGGYKTESIISNRLGEPAKETYFIKGDSVKHFSSRQNSYFFLNQELNFDRFYGNTGFFVNANNKYATRFYPEINLSYRIFGNLRIYANYTTSFRIPSFTELYYNVGKIKGDLNLQPEEAQTAESGIKIYGNLLKLNVAAFYRHTRNFIDKVKYNNNDTLYFINIPDVYTSGFDITAVINTASLFETDLKLNAVLASFQYIHKNDFPYISYYAANYLKHKFSSNIIFSYKNVWFADINFWYKFRNGEYFDENGLTRNYQPVGNIDIKLSYQRGRINLFAEIRNLTNTIYYDFPWVPMPGRSIYAGIAIETGKALH